MFTGFPEKTAEFLLDLRFHNSTEWFNENRDRYLRDVQAPFYAFIEDAVPVMRKIDPMMEIRPHKLLSRIRRDTRFSKDKSPYRDHHWIWFKQGGEERWQSLGFWFEFGPQRVSWGLATWDENRPMMDRFRREFAADPGRYAGIIRGCGLAERHLHFTGDGFRRMEVPSAIPEDLEAWYRCKAFSVSQARPDLRETGSRAVLTHVLADYEAMAPVYRMLRGMRDEPDNTTGRQRKTYDEW